MYVFFIKLFFIYMFLGIEIDLVMYLYMLCMCMYLYLYMNIRNGCFKKFIKLSVKIILVR